VNPPTPSPRTERSIAATDAIGTRNAIAIRHTGLVRFIARQFAHRIPDHVEVNDLVQAGMVGLLEAAQRFAPGHGASFETYAWIRIRGAIVDFIRKTDWSTRSLRRGIREVEIAKCRIQNESGARPRPADVAAAAGMTLEKYQSTLLGAEISDLRRLDARGDHAEACAGDESIDTEADPSIVAEREELRCAVAVALDGLPERERMVLALYYFGDLTLRGIGEKLGLTESRICQIHHRSIQRLRLALNEWAPTDANAAPLDAPRKVAT
jgi:RNA polymerase sigma factor for flagellar operon FliA